MQYITDAQNVIVFYNKLKLSINYTYREYNTIILLQIT